MARHDEPMTKRQAIEALGGNYSEAARLIGISPQAVRKWPDPLSNVLQDRVHAALWRRQQAERQAAMERWARAQETTNPNKHIERVALRVRRRATGGK
jgi:hypothetical protein